MKTEKTRRTKRRKRNRTDRDLTNLITLAKRIYFMGYRKGLDDAWNDAIETVRKP